MFGQTILPFTKSSLLSKYPGGILVFTLKGLKGRRLSKIEVSKRFGSPRRKYTDGPYCTNGLRLSSEKIRKG